MARFFAFFTLFRLSLTFFRRCPLSLWKIIGGGGGAPRAAASFYSAKLCINFSRRIIRREKALSAPYLFTLETVAHHIYHVICE